MRHYSRLLCGAAAIAILTSASAAQAETKAQVQFDIPAQPLTAALNQFGIQSGSAILFKADVTGAKISRPLTGPADPELALAMMLDGTGLSYRREGQAFVIVSASDPQSGSAAGDGAEGTVAALVVTAQKREENIQDVPIAMSAFTQEDLTRSQVAGGPDLVTQVPNFTFTKTNFSSYSIQIRGIGTQAISATTDPAVAVAFNNTPFIRNRFFEQEFYDLERVEVLRGPQGTLYGRNATAGVVNIISAKPKFTYDARLSLDVGNYSSHRLEGMLNIPLVEDKVALRVAGAWTKRDGYDTNQLSGNRIDGRDLWSTRVSLRFAPTDKINANLIWEHFQEDDDRLRSGKQLCKKDVVTKIGDFVPDQYPGTLPDAGQGANSVSTIQGRFSQGCVRNSLYSPDSFQTPNGYSLPYYVALGALGLPVAEDPRTGWPIDPYISATQSPDLRVIESTIDPRYRAKNDLGELQFSVGLTDALTLTSETAYAADSVYSLQDFNRFDTKPNIWSTTSNTSQSDLARGILTPDGYFCDPQLGCSNRLVAVDVATSKSRQFSQEFRLASDYDGPFNFSVGANFLRADSMDKYYVFINSLTLAALSDFDSHLSTSYIPNQSDNTACLNFGMAPGNPNASYPTQNCVYIDPNPIGSINDLGHNYFLSENPFKLISYAVFGETYYRITNNLKVTAGLRWTVDKKEAPRIPTWLLVVQSVGYPVERVIRQEWREPTGRLTLDWKPNFGFTDETLLYASYSHGYKAGGANPPGFIRSFYTRNTALRLDAQPSVTRPTTFAPEFINAFEAGAKNTFLDGKATLNLAAFYYDYTGYQVSEIVDRSAYNRNFDATVWGLELESDWRPLENLKLGFKGGYEKTRIADGEQAVDLMDRTAGKPGWLVVKPFPTYPSNCILPTWIFFPPEQNGRPFSPGGINGGNEGPCEIAYTLHHDPVTDAPYGSTTPGNLSTLSMWEGTYPGFDPSQPDINNGEGFFKQLGGNELPNAPHWTATTTADYTLPLANDWLMTLHTDVHWQSQSWWRVFNDHVYDKLHPYFTMNLAAIFTNEERGWNVMAYVKNVTDETAITGAFLNSDDTGLTTNVFLTEPRLYGLRVTKAWTGGPWWTGANPAHPAGEPYPLTVELGGVVERQDAPYETISPDFLSGFHSVIDPRIAQHRDLDWGDGREIKLTYQPGSGAWNISADLRYGKTNTETTRLHRSDLAVHSCLITGASYCSPDHKYGLLLRDIYNWSDTAVRSDEEHSVLDFSVGRDVGVGLLSRGHSTVSAGLRYASFDSATRATITGAPDWVAPTKYITFQTSHFHQYSADVSTQREFKGAGPILSWDAGKQLIGDESVGHVDLDWNIAAGVLFGKQKTSVDGNETAAYWSGRYKDYTPRIPTVTAASPLGIEPRSKSVSVPVVDLSVGLSYAVQRIKLSTGYRWERYFNVLDAGYAERKQYDRTIDGPYFKIAVGFGG